ncbi:hypothetical protein PF005_g18815 [Phytophthora fragariae]|uniref:Cyclic nucleotide-binding domain-containing protein n=3 Tax=Phytophthora fragariae TaxID=53985 RepID=A0A6A3WUV6_9STRA|nr:hypothetical protein PF005_g18815 [Phytophthora fragariae]
MAMLLRQRGRTGSSELMMAENHNAFDPSSRFIRTCQQLRLAAILFELAVIPFLAAFHPEATRSQLVAVYVCELLFCADIYVQLNTGYYENGNVLRDARKARRKYLSSPAFLADLLALAPLSVVLPSSTTGSRSIALLEMHKLVRMWRLPALASNLDDLYARHFTSLKLTKVLGFTLMLTHFVACGRFSFGYDHPASGEEPNHWLPHAPHDGHHTIRRQYLMSLFWAFGLLTGGFEGELPRYNAEFAFTIVVGLCGFTLFTSLCATFFLLSKCESGDAELAEARVHQFQHILAFHRVPVQLQAQAVDYLQRYHTQAEANDREAARRLCPSISVDIQVELLEATVALVPVFAGCDSLFIRAVTRLLELVALPARVALFRAGDHGDAMYIVHTGVLHTVVGGVKVRELRKGSFVALNIMTDFVLWINVYGSLHLSFSVNSEKILEPTRTAERYMSSGKLFLDLCCSWPYWIFLPAKFTHPALRLPRLIGGYRLRGYVSEAEAYFRLTSRHKLMLLGVLFVMLYHIVACLYFSTTYIDGFSSGENQWLPSEDVYLLRLNTTHFGTISGTALPADSTQVQEIRAEQYFRSLYYAANVLAAVGRMVEPTSDTEYGAALIFMLSGFFITAIVVDHVQKGFTASALEQKEFFAARARFQRFLKRQNAPFSIHLRVNSFLDFWWSAHRGAIIDELLEDLPAAIKRDVVRSICTPAMDSLEMLCATTSNPEHEGATPVEESSGPTILEQLEDIFLDNIKFVLYGQGEIIYRRGDYASGLFFLLEGKGRYLRSVYFAIDMAALLPLFILNWTLTSPRLEVLNINKMLRYFKGSSQFRTLETKYVKLTTELRLLKLVYYSFLASHMFGCIWFDFAAHRSGVHIVMSGGNDWLPNFGSSLWVPYQSLESAARGLQYLASIFWSYGLMSNSSQGELPKTVGECIFSVVVMTTGFFLFAYVVGHISDVIELQDSENRHFVAKLSSLRQLLRHFDLPPRVEEKFKEYFFFKRFHSITQEHVLERVLPPSLVVDMRMFQLQPMIVKVAFLVGMEDSVTRMLVSLFTQVLFVKDEFICHFGEEGSEMFFIYTGVLDIYIPLLPHAGATSAGGAVVFPTAPSGARVSLSGLRKVNEITAGSYFGEAALFTNTPRNAFVKANTSCILYKLSRHSLELVFVRYPEWQQKVLRIVKIQQQQQRLQRLAYEAQAPDGGPSNRRRGLRRTASRMDLVNARAENIEQLLLSHRKGPNSTDDAPRRLRTWIIQQWRKLQAATLVVRWVVPALRSLQAIAKQLAHGAEIQSPFYLQWMRLVSICTVYVAVLVPYRLTYDSLDRWNVIPVCLRIGEALCEVVFWLDIWFQFHMRANQAAMELYEQDQLVGYKRERLALDLAATFPLDHFATSFSSGPSRLSLCKWLRLNRCLKVANVVYYRNEITRRSVSYEVNRAQTLWLLYLLAMFWTSCAYFAVSIYDGFGTEWQNWLPSSVLDSDDPSPELLMLRLFRGLAFAVTAFVKKSRTFVPASQLNFAFTIVISFIGQLIMALMIAEMANVFLLYIDNEVQFRKNHLIVERSLTRWKVSTALKQRADNFLTSWWSSHAGVDYQLIFEDLPASVRTEGIMVIAKQPLSLFMYRVFRPLIRGGVHSDGDVDSGNGNKDEDKTEEKGEGAEEAEKPDYGVTFHLANLTYSIAKCLRFEGYPRGEAVIVEGSVCKTMYFVVRGSLLSKSVSNPLMYPASRYRGGDYFGEIGLLGHSVSLMTVTSIRACDLFVLKSEHLLQVLKSHPYFSLVLATAQLAVQQKKSTTEFVTEWFNSNDDDGEEIESSDSSENDSDDGEEEDEDEVDEASANGGIVTEDTTLRRRSQQLRRALRGASPEVMEAWEDTFELFMEMLVPKGSISTT